MRVELQKRAACVVLALTLLQVEPASAAEPAPQLKQLLSGPQDLTDTRGKLHFVVTPIRLIREVEEPPLAPRRCFPPTDGTGQDFGRELKALGRGIDSPEETNAASIIRATTRNGLTFDQRETVIEPSVSLPDVWDRRGQKGSHPPGWRTLPDADDPPDSEIYSGNRAGKTTRSRFFLRSANLYAVTSKSHT